MAVARFLSAFLCLCPTSALQLHGAPLQSVSRRCLRRTAASMTLRVGDSLVAGSDWNSSSPQFGIVRAQQYELVRVYYQGLVDGQVRRVDVDSVDAEPPAGCAGFTLYYALFSKRYHAETGPVIVKPNEVQIVTVKDELADSAWLALPGLFWVWVAYTFYTYGQDHGFIF